MNIEEILRGGYAEITGKFDALEVLVSEHVVVSKWTRRPRSRKRRIRKKWMKRPRNWRQRPASFQFGNTLAIHPALWARLRGAVP